MRCGLGRSGRLHSDEYLLRMCPPLENPRAALREAMQDWVAKLEEDDPGAWDRIVWALIDPSVIPLTQRFRSIGDEEQK